MSKRSNTFRKQRERWFKQHPYCYYCGRQLVLFNGCKNIPDNAATIDHLRPRGHPQRTEPNRFRLHRRVLACRVCNLKRDQEFTSGVTGKISLEDRWRKAGHWPRMAYQSGALPGEVT